MSPRSVIVLLACVFCHPTLAQESVQTDPQSGLVLDDNWELVYANCSACHSPKLIIQNRMSASDWLRTIRWMQEKHNLWDLGANEEKIIAYLEKNYGVRALQFRRKPLDHPPIETEQNTP